MILTFVLLESSRPTVGVISNGGAPETWRCIMKRYAASDLLRVVERISSSFKEILVRSNWSRNSLWCPRSVYDSLTQSSPARIEVATQESRR